MRELPPNEIVARLREIHSAAGALPPPLDELFGQAADAIDGLLALVRVMEAEREAADPVAALRRVPPSERSGL